MPLLALLRSTKSSTVSGIISGLPTTLELSDVEGSIWNISEKAVFRPLAEDTE
jgi:hypothetical protein